MDLLHLCLTSTYFQYNGKHYKQQHETATGSPVSIAVAEIVMQNIEEQALAPYSETLPLWLRRSQRGSWRYDHCCTQKQNRWIQRTLEQT